MKKFLCILALTLGLQQDTSAAAVTYEFNGGRLGDQLVIYTHARWVAYKYNIPFLYLPFDHADQLRVSTVHQQKTYDYKEKVVFPTFPEQGSKVDLDSVINPSEQTLYVIPFFPESSEEALRLNSWHFEVNWEDKAFSEIIRNELSPLKPFQKIDLPKDCISVAVHMRKGGGFKNDRLLQEVSEPDPEVSYADVTSPLKFAPFEYFVEQIIKLSELLDNQPIYAHIFTDDKNPGALVEKCKKAVNKPNIMFNSRESDNRHDANVLDDFFALTQFDCLIRGESNFSLMASKLGNYKIQISPTNFRWEGTKLIITETQIVNSLF